ncbi:DUF4347 domain-containing protein, partial [Gammaproteobacteria bacterium LSUCC0112]
MDISCAQDFYGFSAVFFDGSDQSISALAEQSLFNAYDLTAYSNPLDVITDTIRGKQTNRLHIVAHGYENTIVVGTTLITPEFLESHVDLLASWHVVEICLWSCHVGADSELVQTLARLTGARVLASDGPLGRVGNRSHWKLDGHVGDDYLPFAAQAAESWPHQLAALLFSVSAFLAEDARGAAGAGKANVEDNLLKLLAPVNQAESAVKFLFMSDPEIDPIYSGNNVRGTLYAINASNQVVGSYFGEVSRLVKTGANVEAATLYVYPDPANPSATGTPSTTILINFGLGRSFATGNEVRTSSDPVDSALNKLLGAPQAPTASADTDTAYEQGGAANATSDAGDGDPAHPNASGNTLSNDTGGITTYSIVSNALVISTTNGLTVTQVTSQLSGATGSPAANSTSTSNGLVVAGLYGTLTIGQNGSYVYDVDDTNSAVQALRLSSNTLTETFNYTLSNAKGLLDTDTLSITIKGINDHPDANNDYNYAKESIESLSEDQYAVTDKLGRKATGNVLDNDTDVDRNSEEEFVVGVTITGSATGTSQGVVTYTANMTTPGHSSISVSDIYYVYSLSSDGLTATPLFHVGSSTTRVTVASRDGSGANFKLTFSDSASLRSVTDFIISTDTTNPLTSGGRDYIGTITAAEAPSSTTVAVSGQTGNIAVGMTVSNTGLDTAPTVSELNYFDGVLTSVTLSAAVAVNNASLGFSATGTLGSNLQGQYGVLVLSADGSYTYTPTANNPGLSQGQTVTEVFNYTMRDAAGSSNVSSRDSATLTISVQGTGTDDPVAINDSVSGLTAAVETGVSAGRTATGNLLTNDLETNSASGPVSTTVKAARSIDSTTETTVNSSGSISLNGLYGSLAVSADGNWTYTPDNSNTTVNALNSSQTLVDKFYYRVGNTLGTGTSAATLSVEIKGANDAPVAQNDAAVAVEDQVNPSGSVLLNDSDVDNADTRTVINAQAGTSTSFDSADAVSVSSTSSSNGKSIVGTYGTLVLGADGTYTYSVNNSNTTVQGLKPGDTPLQDEFTYQISDAAGATTTAKLTISVKGSDDAPVNTIPASLSTTQGATLAINSTNTISVNDIDGNLSTVTLSVENGVLSVTAGGSDQATIAAGASGTSTFKLSGTQAQINAALATLTYTPNPDFYGTDYLNVYSLDGNNLFDLDTVEITVAEVALTVTSPSVNEASAHAVFTVDGTLGQSVTLALGTGTATAATDYTASMEVSTDGGQNWTSYTSGNVVLNGTNGTLLVRVPLINDDLFEGSETFTLTATPAFGSNATAGSGSGVTGTATIKDDGTGSGGTDNDTPTLSVSSPTVAEGSSAVFTVSLSKASSTAVSFTPALSSGTATLGTDTAAASTLEVST